MYMYSSIKLWQTGRSRLLADVNNLMLLTHSEAGFHTTLCLEKDTDDILYRTFTNSKVSL